MAREIKFRAWDPQKGALRAPGSFYVDSGEGIAVIADNAWPELILMQLTGLHDKNGKEIYEGDLVKVEKGRVAEVKYQMGEFLAMAPAGKSPRRRLLLQRPFRMRSYRQYLRNPAY